MGKRLKKKGKNLLISHEVFCGLNYLFEGGFYEREEILRLSLNLNRSKIY